MNKYTTALKALSKIVRNPWLLNHVLQDKDEWEKYVEDHYPSLTSLPVINFDQLAGDNLQDKLSLFTFLDGGSLVTDILLLKVLAGKFEHCSYFEIGTWRGESVSNVAEVSKECFTLNLSDEELMKMGVDQRVIELQGFFSKKLKNVVHLRGNSKSFNFAGLNKKFDLIFIDGSHHYAMVKNDTEKVFTYLVHQNSIVVWHDYAITPEETRYEVFAGILDAMPKKMHDRLFHVAHTKSAIYTPQSLEGRRLQSPVIPESFFQVDLRFKKVD